MGGFIQGSPYLAYRRLFVSWGQAVIEDDFRRFRPVNRSKSDRPASIGMWQRRSEAWTWVVITLATIGILMIAYVIAERLAFKQ